MDFNTFSSLEFKPQIMIQGSQYFVSQKGNQKRNGLKLVHSLDHYRVNDFVKGVKEDNYQFYDDYPNAKEVVILGSTNVGKSSLINALNNGEKIAYTSKDPGKTQELNFYLVQNTVHRRRRGMLVDTPGYGYIEAPEHLKAKWRKMVFKYLGFGVRVNMVLLLVNGHLGLKQSDLKTLEDLAVLKKPVQVVLTKVDKIRHQSQLVQVTTETSS